MKVLALDTSSSKTGYAVYADGQITSHGSIKLRGRGETPSEQAQDRLRQLYTKLGQLITRYKITRIVAEDIFKDSDIRKQSAFDVLAQCRGVLIALSEAHQLPPIKFLNPGHIKSKMWNYTTSRRDHRTLTRQEHKERMCRAVERLGYQLNTDRNGNKDNDQADALGILITYLESKKHPIKHPNAK